MESSYYIYIYRYVGRQYKSKLGGFSQK
uniref:Uncharacterized protein n=1 Tax=Lepeophtheirus salmonis TaxID=72036 RepID=A0A0K2UIL4_LEPSM